jgi:hypothetical protein
MEMETNMLVMKVALSTSVVLAALIIVENAYARPLRYWAVPVDYSVTDPRYQRNVIVERIGRDTKSDIRYLINAAVDELCSSSACCQGKSE